MPGWFRIHQDLIESPKMLDAAHALSLEADLSRNGRDMAPEEMLDLYRNVAIGALVRLWSYAETHIRDDDTLPMSEIWVDTLLRIPGFCGAMPDDWVEVASNGRVRLPDYCEKNDLINRRLKREADAKRKRDSRRRDTGAGPSGGRPADGGGSETETETEVKTKKPDFANVENLDPIAWAAWIVYRRAEKLRTYQSTQVATKLAQYPAAVQRAAVDQAITAGWQGLQPQKVQNEKSGQRGASRSFEESTKRLADWYLEQTGGVLPIDD